MNFAPSSKPQCFRWNFGHRTWCCFRDWPASEILKFFVLRAGMTKGFEVQRSKVTGKINRSLPDSRISVCVCFLCGDLEHDPVLIHASSSSSPLSSSLITSVVFMNSRCKNFTGPTSAADASWKAAEASSLDVAVCLRKHVHLCPVPLRPPEHAGAGGVRGNGPGHGNLIGGGISSLVFTKRCSTAGSQAVSFSAATCQWWLVIGTWGTFLNWRVWAQRDHWMISGFFSTCNSQCVHVNLLKSRPCSVSCRTEAVQNKI